MRHSRALAALPLLALACCTPSAGPEPAAPPVVRPAPPPAPPAPPPAPPPTVMAQAVYENWLDAPQTPGNWTYTNGNRLSYAVFSRDGDPARFGVECMKSNRQIRLVRASNTSVQMPMRIRTETAQRLMSAKPSPDNRPMLVATLKATDSLLDAIALSRGRFAVETGGLETLYLPAWAEVTRVIEDCR